MQKKIVKRLFNEFNRTVKSQEVKKYTFKYPKMSHGTIIAII